MDKILAYMAHVRIPISAHEGHVTHEMALDVGDPDLEETLYTEGEEEIWEERTVVLEEDYEKAIEQARREERERIATYFEENDYGIMDGDVVSNIIRAMPEEDK